MKEEMEAWVAYTNSDCTEGRGFDIPIAVCASEATAIRLARKAYVQGSDGPVRKFTLFTKSGYWYGPVNVIRPTDEDKMAQDRIDRIRAAAEKARVAGLSNEDIQALQGVCP